MAGSHGQMGTSLVKIGWNQAGPGSSDSKLHPGWRWSVDDPGANLRFHSMKGTARRVDSTLSGCWQEGVTPASSEQPQGGHPC